MASERKTVMVDAEALKQAVECVHFEAGIRAESGEAWRHIAELAQALNPIAPELPEGWRESATERRQVTVTAKGFLPRDDFHVFVGEDGIECMDLEGESIIIPHAVAAYLLHRWREVQDG